MLWTCHYSHCSHCVSISLGILYIQFHSILESLRFLSYFVLTDSYRSAVCFHECVRFLLFLSCLALIHGCRDKMQSVISIFCICPETCFLFRYVVITGRAQKAYSFVIVWNVLCIPSVNSSISGFCLDDLYIGENGVLNSPNISMWALICD